MRRVWGLVCWFVGLLAALWFLHTSGAETGMPSDPGGWPTWATETAPELVVAGCLQTLALGLAWYLVAASALALAAVVVDRPSAWLRLVPGPIRRLLLGAGSFVVTAGSIALATAPLTVPTPAAADTGTQHEPAGDGTDPAPAAPRTAPASPVEGETDEATAALRPFTIDGAWLAAMASQQHAPAAPADVWVTAPGDHLWAVAAETLSDAWGRSPHDAEVHHYWQRLVSSNTSRLVDPSNPDLIYPGQVFVLPAVAGDQSAGV